MKNQRRVDVQHQRGKRGRRVVQESSSRTVTEDIAEAESTSYSKTEIHHADSWKRGANLGAVAVCGGVVLILSGVWSVPMTLVGLSGAVVTLVTVFVASCALPPLIVSFGGVWIDSLALLHQHKDRRIATTAADRNLIKVRDDRTATVIDGEYRIAQTEQRANNHALAAQVKNENDLSVFIAAVFSRGESLSFRHWQNRSLPSGRKLKHEQWKDEFIAPCLAIGAIEPPAGKGKPYTANSLRYDVVHEKLTTANYLK